MKFFKDTNIGLILILVASVCLLSGCGTLRHAVPSRLQSQAQISGMPDVRAFADVYNEVIQEDLIQSAAQEPEGAYEIRNGAKIYSILSISGGSANGAYGAGLLKGWSASGTRPNFKIVSGISTGALIAPVAFLGSDYDYIIEEFYTTVSTKDIMKKKSVLAMMFGDSFASNKPLAKIIKNMVTKEILAAITEEYNKGRRLYVGTANLDAQRLVLWDMGKIASMGDDESLELFRKVLLTAAAIPAAFPPSFFEVKVDGEKYDEMHVDGSTVTQVFSLYGVLDGAVKEARDRGIASQEKKIDFFVIRNGYIYPAWQEVGDSIPDIAGRSLDTVINANGIGDIFRLYVFSKERGVNFYYAYIPVEGESLAEEMFDPREMKRLFDMGYEKAKAGYPWKTEPPSLQHLREHKD